MAAEPIELLFFDTFSHESSEELNLDLVQFPKPVFVTEVRIIPLGARVQADFPGGVRLGATNPSQFSIEFFVNDLGKPGASTFESLGGLEYNQNGCIHLACINNEVNVRQIPTDGLVLRGWYTTITLAVYGTLTKNITEQIIAVATNTPATAQQPTALVADVQQIVAANPVDQNWQQDVIAPPVPIEYNQPPQVAYGSNYGPNETYPQDYHMEYYEPPKDPRYHHTPESEWDPKSGRARDTSRPPRDVPVEREPPEHQREVADRHYSRSHSRDRDRRETYRETSRDRDREWDRERSQTGTTEYRDKDKDWDRYKHQEPYRRSRDSSYGRGISPDREEPRKRPRTPPMASPKRPHTPHGEKELSPGDVESISEDEIAAGDKIDKQLDLATPKPLLDNKPSGLEPKKLVQNEPDIEDAAPIDLEQFEPILSDEDICDESENFADIDYDFNAFSNNDDVIKLFNPLTTDLQKYRSENFMDIHKLVCEFGDCESVYKKINEYFVKYDEQVINLQVLLKTHLNKYGTSDFKNFSPEVKEEFVFACEQLPLLLNNKQFAQFVQLNELVLSQKLQIIKLEPFYADFAQIQKTVIEFVNVSLDFDFALSQNQPGFKIRHIKCGIRLVESCCINQEFTNLLVDQNVHIKLLQLFDKEYMALSIKLLILRSIDACLSTQKSIDHFITKRFNDKNGYQTLVSIMKTVTSVRVKFAINSLMTKLNIYEILEKMRTTVLKWVNTDVDTSELRLVLEGMEQVLRLYQKGAFEISQPKRFLPVSAQFEINRGTDTNVLFKFFSIHKLLECCLILLTHPKTQCVSVSTIIHDFLNELSNTPEGLTFLSGQIPCLQLLTKCFLHPEDLEAQYTLSESVFIKSQSLGLTLAYKLQILYHVEALFDLGPKNNFDCDTNEILDHLHSMFCLTYVNVAKIAVSAVLSLGRNPASLLQFLRFSNDSDNLEFYFKVKKSPGISYIIDLLALVVAHSTEVGFLEKYGKQLLLIAQQHDKFESTTAQKLNEILTYLKPLENATVFAYDDIKPLCEMVKLNLENLTTFPGQLITSLRILKHLGISVFNTQSPQLENSNYNLVELKYKYVILQLFSLDGVANFVEILTKICAYYEQPNLHTATFASAQGAIIMNTVLPSVQLLKQMLMHVIHCRNTEYKDLTAVAILLQVFNMAHSFPISSIAYSKSREVCKEIIDTLLIYSQPVSDEISENDSLNKTLWTLMAGEVIKYITNAPYTFIPGLLIFSELLPLPLPFQTCAPLSDDEIKRAINLRKLWSAHLHSHSSAIQELINKLCTSIHQPLLHLLRRVCIQLSDLAANTAIMIARGVLDSVHIALIKPEKAAIFCSGHTARLLHFLACLTTHGAIKCAILQLLWSHANSLKIDEKYHSLVGAFCQILKSQSDLTSHLQAQECIVNIFQNLSDNEITLIQTTIKTDTTSDLYLSNSLPPKDMLVAILATLLEHFTTECNTFTTLLPIVRTFILLTEHDYGFHHLCAAFDKKPSCFLSLLKKISSVFARDNTELLQTLNTVLDFLRVSSDDMEIDATIMFTPRSVKLNLKELKLLIGWKLDESQEKQHPLYLIESLIKKNAIAEDPLEIMLENLSNLIRILSVESESNTQSALAEPVLQTPDTLLGQFASRPVFTLTDISEEQLTTAYWLAVPADEIGTEVDHVSCDLMEVCKQHLTAETNINREVERLIRVYPSQDVARLPAEQLKIKRPNSDGLRNDKMKKPYVTPMRGRGFPRTAPQRGDLFRSRPPNTSRPPSLHVDDFVALETCGAQPTGPTGYNKLSRDLLNTRVVRSVRGQTFISPDRGVHFRPI